jgi:hypothetical protein
MGFDAEAKYRHALTAIWTFGQARLERGAARNEALDLESDSLS